MRHSARCASDKDAHDSIPCYLRGKLERGEAIILVDGSETTPNEIILVKLFECDTSIERENWSDDDMVQITGEQELERGGAIVLVDGSNTRP